MSSSSSDDDAYGPALPPHLLRQKTEEKTKSLAVIGPSLPPGFKSSTSSSNEMTQQDAAAAKEQDEKVDPLPRSKAQHQQQPVIGPRPPAHLYASHDKGCSRDQDKHKHAFNEIEGEEDVDDDDDDDGDIGPYPPDHPKSQKHYYNQSSSSMARSGLGSSSSLSKGKPKREEWMLIPPKNKPISNLALGPRKFLTRSLDNSTAADAIHRRDSDDEDAEDAPNEEDDEGGDRVKAEFQAQLISKRDELMSDLQEQSESGAESLLSSHRKNLKKKRKLEEEEAAKNSSKVDRRPFDRDTDLSISRMNADDKKRFINRATTELKGRFSHSRKTGKFL